MKTGFVVMFALLALGCGTMLGGSHSSTSQQPPEGLVALTNTQIAMAFSGHAVWPDEEDFVTGSGGPDMFCPSGVFWKDRHRAGLARGAYQVEAGRLCTQVGGARRCRYVFRSSGGTVLMSNRQDGARGWPVRFADPTPRLAEGCAGSEIRQTGF